MSKPVPSGIAAPPPAPPPPRGVLLRDGQHVPPPSLVSITTLVLWTSCLVIGTLGLLLRYPTPPETPPAAPPLQTKLINVQLEQQQPAPAPPPPVAPPSQVTAEAPSNAPPAPPQPLALPAAPALAVAAPTPAIAFAVPVAGLTKLVDPGAAAHGGPLVSNNPPASVTGASTGGSGNAQGTAQPAPAPTVTRLTLGQGEGNQPAPDYPREAALAGREGAVTLHFTVDSAGKVIAVKPTVPCRWPLLNRAAVRAIQQTWHFAPGPQRDYEVTIEFQLNH